MLEYKTKMKSFLLALLGFTLLFSCAKKEATDEILDLGYNYFPTDSGSVKIYAVDSISYNDNTQSIDTFHFLLKEQVGGVITGQNLAKHIEIIKSVQFDSTSVWQPRNSSFVLITENNFQLLDENVRTVKLVFPIGNVLNWNGNQFNNKGKRNFLLQNIGSTYKLKDSSFQNCIIVQEALANNVIEEILIKSVYCKNIGLIEFTNNYINTQSAGKSGYKVHQKIIYYSIQ
jgi:hypothetical protein